MKLFLQKFPLHRSEGGKTRRQIQVFSRGTPQRETIEELLKNYERQVGWIWSERTQLTIDIDGNILHF